MDQHRSSFPNHREPYRADGKPSPTSHGDDRKKEAPTNHVDIIALVRSLQRSAGTTDCFRMGNEDCDSTDCDWRSYCLGKPTDQK